jgi:hypothetical protein
MAHVIGKAAKGASTFRQVHRLDEYSVDLNRGH